MKNKLLALAAIVMALAATSCRETSDTLLAYDYQDGLAFGEGETSFGGKYNIAWKALNQYYALWDYEQQQGLDWDAAYDMYYPKFAALDERDPTVNPVTDTELNDLMYEAFGGLHDGHLMISFKNHHDNNSMVYVLPSNKRNEDRDDAQIVKKYKPNISQYYLLPANGEVEVDGNGQPQTAYYSTEVGELLYHFKNTEGIGLQWISDQIDRYSQLLQPTDDQKEKLSTLKQLKLRLSLPFTLAEYNNLALRYAYLDIPGFDFINPGFSEEGMTIRYALLKGNIPYLYISQFSLSTYLMEGGAVELVQDDPNLGAHIEGIKLVWNEWFSAIQRLGKAGKLGGVVIDLRGNTGGATSDFPYVLGALRPSGDMTFGYERFKRGTGRLDYSMPMPATMKTYPEEHYVVDNQPIVVLTNSASMSMSEITSLATMTLPNGKLIGKRTSGGLCGLTDNARNTLNYSGQIGVEGKTPVYCYCPTLALLNLDYKILEGVGLTPHIEVNFDAAQFDATGKDSQLDRALQYIRTGK